MSQQGPREPRRRARRARGRGNGGTGWGRTVSPRQGGFAGAGVATQIREALEWQQVQLALSPRVEGVTEKHPGRGAADARSDHSEAEAPAPRPGLASRSPSTRRTRSLRQHLPGAHCAPACQDLGAQPRRRDTRPHGKRSHSARLPVQALLTGARRAPTSWLQGAGPTPPVCFSARPPHWSSSGPCSGAYPAVNRKRGTAYVNQVSPHKGTAAGPWSRSSALALRGVRGPARSGVGGPQCTPVGCQHCSLNESRASRRVISRATL